jgi:hypothetical protein
VASALRVGEVDGFADCGGRYVQRLRLHMPGQSPVRYRARCARCLAVNASAYLWRSADAARRAALWALPVRYAEIVPVCAGSTPRPLSIPRELDLNRRSRVDTTAWLALSFAHGLADRLGGSTRRLLQILDQLYRLSVDDGQNRHQHGSGPHGILDGRGYRVNSSATWFQRGHRRALRRRGNAGGMSAVQ